MMISAMRNAGMNGMPCLIFIVLLYFFRRNISFAESP